MDIVNDLFDGNLDIPFDDDDIVENYEKMLQDKQDKDEEE